MAILVLTDLERQGKLYADQKDTLFIFCTTKGNTELLDTVFHALPPEIHLNRLAVKIASFFGFKHPPLVVSNACISSLQGIVVARRLLAAGQYKRIVIAGADVVSKFVLSGFRAFNALSNSPCMPFDARRQGINLGEAAAAMVLSGEPIENSVEVVAGYTTNDATHISAPSRSGDGLFKAIGQVLAHTTTAAIDFVNTHGTATVYNDEMECQALARSGLDAVPLHSLKGYFGHTLGAAGILESIMSIYSLQKGKTIPSRGYESVGTSVALCPIRNSEQRPMREFLKTSSGFGGCNAAVLFRKAEPQFG